MKYFIQTYGCQMNVSDSSAAAGHMESLGMARAGLAGDADVIILNTCAVRLDTERRALAYIGRLRPLKENKPELKVIVSGCVAQKLGVELKKRFPFIDLIVGAREIDHFGEIYNRTFGFDRVSAVQTYTHLEPRSKESPVTGFVTVTRGCNNYCSYCVVPYVRGPEKSRPANDIIEEIKACVALGLPEVMLLGQNVNSYREQASNKAGKFGFPELLDEVNKIEGLKRIRFMTSHPKDLSPELIERFKILDKLCGHLHLPLQSGSDKILKGMGRGYTTAGYIGLIDEVRKKVPGISLTTDILTGFPGETEKDFAETLALIELCAFDSVFAFKYSPREGTAAFKMPETVSTEVKEERHSRVRETADKISAAKHKGLIDSTQSVLVERVEGEKRAGRTGGNLKVFFKAPENAGLSGRLADVEIIKTRINTLEGKYAGERLT